MSNSQVNFQLYESCLCFVSTDLGFVVHYTVATKSRRSCINVCVSLPTTNIVLDESLQLNLRSA